MPNHTISQGECLTSIAAQYGFLWTTIWNDPANADLKRQRQDPNILYPGDVLFIPERQPKEQPAATDQKHPFVAKGAPAKLRLRLLDGATARANLPYQLQIDGAWLSGTTDGDGYLEHPIPPNARSGQLLAGNGAAKDVFEFQFGTIDPIDTNEGVTKRLVNLGYDAQTNFAEALLAFQQANGLEATGKLDAATREQVRTVFGQ